MILDTFENVKQYKLHPNIEKSLYCGMSFSKTEFNVEKYNLSEDDFLLPSTYVTDSSYDRPMEAHRQYVDVMIMIEGEERIWVKPTSKLQNIYKQYEPEEDCMLASCDDDCTEVRLSAGMFIILFPEDAHSPGNAVESTGMLVRKVIGKVKVSGICEGGIK